MFGSFGWGITMFFVGMALDNSTRFTDHPCGPHIGERNYVTCFTIFAVLMFCAFVAATQFKFAYDSDHVNDGLPAKQNYYEDLGPKPWLNTAPPINKPQISLKNEKKFEFIDRWRV